MCEREWEVKKVKESGKLDDGNWQRHIKCSNGDWENGRMVDGLDDHQFKRILMMND
jgi:hypothetical protein